jgi:hypothetical protein
MAAYYLIGLLMYAVVTIPGFIIFFQGKKLQGAFVIATMIALFKSLSFIQSDTLHKSLFNILTLLWILQIFYLLFLFINKSKKKKEVVKEITILDIIKGFLFIGFLIFALFLSGAIFGLISLIFAQYKEVSFLQGPVVIILLIASITAGILGFGILIGRPLWMLWKSNIPKKSKADEQ